MLLDAANLSRIWALILDNIGGSVRLKNWEVSEMHFAGKLLPPFLFKGAITSSSNSEVAKLALIEKLYNLNAYDISHEGDTISFKNHLCPR